MGQTIMYDSLLIPTDGSAPAERAAGYGVVLAEAYGATVHALSVVDERDYSDAVVDRETLREAGRESAEREAREAVEAVADLADDVTTRIEVGIPAEAILGYAAANDVDAIAMGTHGRTGIERFVIGSVAERVVRSADLPVVTVRATEFAPTWPPIDRILFTTDGSDASFAALPAVIDLAERFDAAVEGLYVIDARTTSRYYNVATALEEVAGGLRAAAERATDRVETAVADAGVAVTTATVEGVPSEAIREHAERAGADLIAMATHGRTGIARFMLGSVTERVVRNADTPVLTTPTREGDGEAPPDR